jgi:hypothetical protein
VRAAGDLTGGRAVASFGGLQDAVMDQASAQVRAWFGRDRLVRPAMGAARNRSAPVQLKPADAPSQVVAG